MAWRVLPVASSREAPAGKSRDDLPEHGGPTKMVMAALICKCAALVCSAEGGSARKFGARARNKA